MFPPTLADVGARIVAAEIPAQASAADTVTGAARIFSSLRARLGRWIGVDAFDALMQRALAQCRADHEVLAGVRWGTDEPRLWPASATEAVPDALRSAVVAILDELTAHLGRFVGQELAIRLMLHESEDPAGGPRGKP